MPANTSSAMNESSTSILDELSDKQNVSLWREFIGSIYARVLLTFILFTALFAATFLVATRTQERRNFEESSNPNIVPEAEIKIPTSQPEPTESPTAIVGEGCQISGCNSELCVEEGEEIASICIFRPEYTCYQTASCERQEDGECGWTQTEELTSCLAEYQ